MFLLPNISTHIGPNNPVSVGLYSRLQNRWMFGIFSAEHKHRLWSEGGWVFYMNLKVSDVMFSYRQHRSYHLQPKLQCEETSTPRYQTCRRPRWSSSPARQRTNEHSDRTENIVTRVRTERNTEHVVNEEQKLLAASLMLLSSIIYMIYLNKCYSVSPNWTDMFYVVFKLRMTEKQTSRWFHAITALTFWFLQIKFKMKGPNLICRFIHNYVRRVHSSFAAAWLPFSHWDTQQIRK